MRPVGSLGSAASLAALLLVVTTAGSTTTAGATWSAPHTLPSTPQGEIRLTADAAGDALAAWGQSIGSARAIRGAIFVSLRPAGRAFRPPRRLTPAHHDVRAMGLAMSAGSATAIAWRAGPTRASARLYLRRGRTFTPLDPPRRLTPTGSLPNVGWSGAASHTADPVVTVADDRMVTVAWLATGAPGCGFIVRATTISPAGRVTPSRRVSPRCPHATSLRAAVDTRGDGAIVWRAGARCNYGTTCRYSIQAAALRHGRPAAPVTVSRRPVAANGLAIAAGGGRAVIAWRDAAEVRRSGTLGRVLAATLRTGRVGAPVALSVADRIAGVPAVAVGPRGDAVVAWQALSALNRPAEVEVAVRDAGQVGFLAAAWLGGTTPGIGYTSGPLAAVDPAGGAVVAWPHVAGGAMSAARVPSLSWQPPERLSDSRFGLALAAGAPGEALALWTTADANGRLGPLAWALRPAP